MNRMVTLSFTLLTLTLASSCATNARRVKLVNEASVAAESMGMWTRPTEVGFTLGEEISGTAISNRVIGFNVGESKPAGSVAAVLGPLLGSGPGNTALSATESFAAFKAVTEAEAEGIYITRIESESRGFLFLYRTNKVTVHGRALHIEDYGAITQDRADEWRFRNRQPDVVVIKDGETTVSLPIEKRD